VFDFDGWGRPVPQPEEVAETEEWTKGLNAEGKWYYEDIHRIEHA